MSLAVAPCDMGVHDREYVPVSPETRALLRKLFETYPSIPRAGICRVALEAGLRQIVVPSGAPSAVRLPVEGGF